MTFFCLFSLIPLNFTACNRPTAGITSENAHSNADLKNITQFRSMAAAGPDSIWVATVRGDLVRVSKQGERRKANIEAGEVMVVTFVDTMHGWVADRQSRIWSTSDGGNSWELASTSPTGAGHFYYPRQLIFVDELHGWLIDGFAIWRTIDGGKTWQDRFSMSSGSTDKVWQPYRATFVNAEAGWVACSGGVVNRTTDGGKTWETRAVDSGGTDFHDVGFIDEQTGWLSGRPNGGIYFTQDGGATWRKQLLSANRTYLNSVHFTDRNEGWAVGWRSTGLIEVREAIVLHTSDGGMNWLEKDIGEKERFFDHVSFYDIRHGWLIARDRIYYTEDGGQSWRMVLTLPPIEKES